MSIRFAVVLIFLMIAGFAQPNVALSEPTAKVTVCHLPPGSAEGFHNLLVSANSVEAHLAHGDLLGPCTARPVCRIEVSELGDLHIKVFDDANSGAGVITVLGVQFDTNGDVLVSTLHFAVAILDPAVFEFSSLVHFLAVTVEFTNVDNENCEKAIVEVNAG